MFFTRPIIRPFSLLQHQCRFRPFSTFQAGDFCMLRELKSNRKYLVGPLEEGQHKDHKGGIIPHTQLMGMGVRSTVRTHNGMFGINEMDLFFFLLAFEMTNEYEILGVTGFMLHKPTLDE